MILSLLWLDMDTMMEVIQDHILDLPVRSPGEVCDLTPPATVTVRAGCLEWSVVQTPPLQPWFHCWTGLTRCLLFLDFWRMMEDDQERVERMDIPSSGDEDSDTFFPPLLHIF